MSEISETMQIVELAGKGAFALGKSSIQAIQFFLQLKYSEEQKALRLKYGELSIDKLQEKQALMGDTAATFHVHTQDEAQLDAIKKELTERGIAFSQLADFDLDDGFTQFYALGSDSPKLNAFFKKHEELEAGAITLDDYFKTASEQQKVGVFKNVSESLETQKEELKKKEFLVTVTNQPIQFKESDRLVNEEMTTKYDYYLFKTPQSEDHHILVPISEVTQSKDNEYLFSPNQNTMYTILSKTTGELSGRYNGEAVYQICKPEEHGLFTKRVTDQESKLEEDSVKKNFVEDAKRLKDDREYMDLVHQPNAREITINQSLLKAEKPGFYSVQVPHTNATMQVDLPKENVRQIDDGKTFVAVIDTKKKYNIRKNGTPDVLEGEGLNQYFSDPKAVRDLNKVKLPTPTKGRTL